MKRLLSLLKITVPLIFLSAMSMSVQAEILAGAIGQSGYRPLSTPFGTTFTNIRCPDGDVPIGLTVQATILRN